MWLKIRFLGDIISSTQTINIKDGDMSMFMGRKSLSIKNSLSTKFGEDGIPTDILQTLPANVRNAVEKERPSDTS